MIEWLAFVIDNGQVDGHISVADKVHFEKRKHEMPKVKSESSKRNN